MERARDRLERIGGIRELVRRRRSRHARRREQQAVVGADEVAAVAIAERERPASAADAWIDDGEVNADRHVGERVREHQRALQDRLRRNPVRDVDDLGLWRDPLDHAVARADEVVLQPEVGEEADEHRRESTRWCPSDGDPDDRGHEPVGVVRSASATTSSPGCSGGPARLRPDRDDGQWQSRAGRGARCRRRGKDDEIAVGRLGGHQLDASGRAARSRRRAPPRAAAARPRRRRTARGPAGRGSSASSPSCVETPRHQVGAAERVRGRLADRGDARRPGGPASAARARRSRSSPRPSRSRSRRSARRRAARSRSAGSARPRGRAPRAARPGRPPGRAAG